MNRAQRRAVKGVVKGLDAASRKRVYALIKASAAIEQTTGTKRDLQRVLLKAQFPSKHAFRLYKLNKAFFSFLRSESDNGDAYKFARIWARETFGGILQKDGDKELGKIVAEGSKGSGMTFGRWANAMQEKCKAFVEYVEQLPVSDIEPEMREEINATAEHVIELLISFEKYREIDKANEEQAKDVAKVKAAEERARAKDAA